MTRNQGSAEKMNSVHVNRLLQVVGIPHRQLETLVSEIDPEGIHSGGLVK
jgi:hypothetical protein